jgi:hypothetical protein
VWTKNTDRLLNRFFMLRCTSCIRYDRTLSRYKCQYLISCNQYPMPEYNALHLPCTYITYIDVLLPIYRTIVYLLYSLLHVSALNLGHPKGATSIFYVYSIFDNLHIRQWQIVYIKCQFAVLSIMLKHYCRLVNGYTIKINFKMVVKIW